MNYIAEDEDVFPNPDIVTEYGGDTQENKGENKQL